MAILAVTDTHALVWAATGATKKLGAKARTFFRDVDAGRAAVYVPTITLVEIADLALAGHITLNASFDIWAARLAATGRHHLAELTFDVVREAANLYDIPERADRLIAATALVLDCPLLTRDGRVAAVARVPRLWY